MRGRKGWVYPSVSRQASNVSMTVPPRESRAARRRREIRARGSEDTAQPIERVPAPQTAPPSFELIISIDRMYVEYQGRGSRIRVVNVNDGSITLDQSIGLPGDMLTVPVAPDVIRALRETLLREDDEPFIPETPPSNPMAAAIAQLEAVFKERAGVTPTATIIAAFSVWLSEGREARAAEFQARRFRYLATAFVKELSGALLRVGINSGKLDPWLQKRGQMKLAIGGNLFSEMYDRTSDEQEDAAPKQRNGTSDPTPVPQTRRYFDD